MKKVFLVLAAIWLALIIYGAFNPQPNTDYNNNISDYSIRWNVILPENVNTVYQLNTPVDARNTLSYSVYSVIGNNKFDDRFVNGRSDTIEKAFQTEFVTWKLQDELDKKYLPDFTHQYSYLTITNGHFLYVVYDAEKSLLYVLENI